MNTILLEPRKALNKAFLKIKPSRAHIELFKINMIALLDNVKKGESEEFHKNEIRTSLKKPITIPTIMLTQKRKKI